MASFLQTLNDNLLYWIDCRTDNRSLITNYSPGLSLEQTASTYLHWSQGVTESDLRQSELFSLADFDKGSCYTYYNAKSFKEGTSGYVRTCKNFYFDYGITSYTIEMFVYIANMSDNSHYTKEEIASFDQDIVLLSVISSRNTGGFKTGISLSDTINDYADDFNNFLDYGAVDIMETNTVYENCIVDNYRLRLSYGLVPGNRYKIVLTSNGDCYIGGNKTSNIYKIRSGGGTISQNVRNSCYNIIIGNFDFTSGSSANSKITYNLAPGLPGTISYMKIYKTALSDDICKQLSKYGSTVEFSPTKKIYTPSRFIENQDIMSIDRNGKIEMSGEIVEGSSQFGFNKNGNLYVDEVVEI